MKELMGESTKAVTALVMIIAGVVALFAWMHDRPDDMTWLCRVGGIGVAMLAATFLVWLQLRIDGETDYLRADFGTYFNRDGFCFAINTIAIDGVAYIEFHYQSQYTGNCVGQIALRPAFERDKGGRAKLDDITCRIECPNGAYGVARVPISIPLALQGRNQPFEVGASVRYPNGKWQRLRFHDGILLRSDTNFHDAFGTAMTIAGAATGSLILSRPATTTVKLPEGVNPTAPDSVGPVVTKIWELGDPQIETRASPTHPPGASNVSQYFVTAPGTTAYSAFDATVRLGAT